MRPFKNNQKRNRNRGLQDRSFKRVNEISRLNSDFGNRENGFRRKQNRNNGNVEKLIIKYNELAREALSNGDKILSENYLQHADHFTRILNERESLKRERNTENRTENNLNSDDENSPVSEKMSIDDNNINEKNNEQEEIKKSAKSLIDVN